VKPMLPWRDMDRISDLNVCGTLWVVIEFDKVVALHCNRVGGALIATMHRSVDTAKLEAEKCIRAEAEWIRNQLTPQPTLESCPVHVYELATMTGDLTGSVLLSRRGREQWSVNWVPAFVMTRDGEWMRENPRETPAPEVIEKTRFTSAQEAFDAWNKYRASWDALVALEKTDTPTSP
jgi:hypothetical protein